MADPKPAPAPTPLGVSLLAEAARKWAGPLIETLSGSFVSLYLYGSAVEPGQRAFVTAIERLLAEKPPG